MAIFHQSFSSDIVTLKSGPSTFTSFKVENGCNGMHPSGIPGSYTTINVAQYHLDTLSSSFHKEIIA